MIAFYKFHSDAQYPYPKHLGTVAFYIPPFPN